MENPPLGRIDVPERHPLPSMVMTRAASFAFRMTEKSTTKIEKNPIQPDQTKANPIRSGAPI